LAHFEVISVDFSAASSATLANFSPKAAWVLNAFWNAEASTRELCHHVLHDFGEIDWLVHFHSPVGGRFPFS
jgi:hypothetical protein